MIRSFACLNGHLGCRIRPGGAMRDPYADAVAASRQKAGLRECSLDRRDLAERCRVDSEIAVRRVRRYREVGVADPHVDGVRADEGDRIAVRSERFKRVEEHSPSQYVQLIHATPVRSRASMR